MAFSAAKFTKICITFGKGNPEDGTCRKGNALLGGQYVT